MSHVYCKTSVLKIRAYTNNITGCAVFLGKDGIFKDGAFENYIINDG